MEATRRETLKALFEQALALPPGERTAFLNQARHQHPDLADDLASLLDHYDQAPDFFDSLAHAVLPHARNDQPPPPTPGSDPHGLVGRTVSHYQILDKLGGGGMGVVYKAHDTKLKRTVALKFLPPYLSADEEARARFIHEAQAASALDHPNIGYVHEIGQTDDGRLFIAMAFYAGETLKAKIARGPLPLGEALDYAVQMAEGLSRAHEAGIVHRDVKPANVIVTDRGRVKVVDFGLAKVQEVSLTKTGATLGTIFYMSPEQTRGEAVDARTDLWALGAVLYELLAGERPFKGDYEQAVIYSVLNEEPVSLAALRPEVSESLAGVVGRLLEKDPADRYQSADDLLVDLQALVGGAEPVSVSPRVAVVPKRGRSRPGLVLGLVSVLVLGLLLAGLWVLSRTGAGGTAEAALSDTKIAVMPFVAQGEDVAHLGEGMADLLSVGLDGAGDLESVDANALIGFMGEDRGAVRDPERGREIAAHFGAGRFVLGTVTQLGRQIRLNAKLYDAEAQLREQAEATARDEEALLSAVDTLLIVLMADLVDEPLRDLVPMAYRTTHDKEALKAFLRGEHLARQGYWISGEAEEALREAVGHDSTFALAWTRMLDWVFGMGSPRRGSGDRQAAAYVRKYRDRLPERERRLADVIIDDSSNFEAKLRQYREVADAYPDFARAWYVYGDYLLHWGSFYGHPASEARPHLEQALRYDPNNSEIYYHLTERAVKDRDFDVLDALLARYEKGMKVMGVARYRATRILSAAGRGDDAQFEALVAALGSDSIDAFGIAHTSFQLAVFLEDIPAAQRVADLLQPPRDLENYPGLPHFHDFFYETARGRLRRADSLRVALFQEQPWNLPRSVQASMSVVYPVTEEHLSALRDHVARWDTARTPIVNWYGRVVFPGRYAEIKAFLTGLVSYRLGDDVALEQATSGLRSLALQKGQVAHGMERLLAALAYWKDGETAQALAALDESVTDGWSQLGASLRQYVHAEILFSEGRYAEALPWYAALNDPGLIIPWEGLLYLGPSYLRRAEIYEHLGQPEEAIDYYTRLVTLWKDADPELQPYVEEAKAHIDRLVKTRAREPQT